MIDWLKKYRDPAYWGYESDHWRLVVEFELLRLVCRVRGHKWVDCSYAGPDSGNMDMECERCGYYDHIPLY